MSAVEQSEAVVPTSPEGNMRASVNRIDVVKGTSQSSLFAMHAFNTTVEGGSDLPAGVAGGNVHVCVNVSLERAQDKEDERHVKLADEVREAVLQGLSASYPAKRDDATLVLKVYVVLASTGNALNVVTLGATGAPVEECLEWFLESADGGTIHKSGRVGSAESALFSRDKVLAEKMTSKLVQEIVTKVGIPPAPPVEEGDQPASEEKAEEEKDEKTEK